MEPAPLLIILEVGNSISPLKKAMVMPSLVSTDMRINDAPIRKLIGWNGNVLGKYDSQVVTNCSVCTQLPSPETQSTTIQGKNRHLEYTADTHQA